MSNRATFDKRWTGLPQAAGRGPAPGPTGCPVPAEACGVSTAKSFEAVSLEQGGRAHSESWP